MAGPFHTILRGANRAMSVGVPPSFPADPMLPSGMLGIDPVSAIAAGGGARGVVNQTIGWSTNPRIPQARIAQPLADARESLYAQGDPLFVDRSGTGHFKNRFNVPILDLVGVNKRLVHDDGSIDGELLEEGYVDDDGAARLRACMRAANRFLPDSVLLNGSEQTDGDSFEYRPSGVRIRDRLLNCIVHGPARVRNVWGHAAIPCGTRLYFAFVVPEVEAYTKNDLASKDELLTFEKLRGPKGEASKVGGATGKTGVVVLPVHTSEELQWVRARNGVVVPFATVTRAVNGGFGQGDDAVRPSKRARRDEPPPPKNGRTVLTNVAKHAAFDRERFDAYGFPMIDVMVDVRPPRAPELEPAYYDSSA